MLGRAFDWITPARPVLSVYLGGWSRRLEGIWLVESSSLDDVGVGDHFSSSVEESGAIVAIVIGHRPATIASAAEGLWCSGEDLELVIWDHNIGATRSS